MPKPAAEKPRTGAQTGRNAARIDSQPTPSKKNQRRPICRAAISRCAKAPRRSIRRGIGAAPAPAPSAGAPTNADVAPATGMQPARVSPSGRRKPDREREQALPPPVASAVRANNRPSLTNARRPLKEPPRLSNASASCSVARGARPTSGSRTAGCASMASSSGCSARAPIPRRSSRSRKTQVAPPGSVTIILNKPEGVVAGLAGGRRNRRCTDPGGKSLARGRDAADLQGDASARDWRFAGKLDAEASGMLGVHAGSSVARRIVGDDTKLERNTSSPSKVNCRRPDLEETEFRLSLDDIKLRAPKSPGNMKARCVSSCTSRGRSRSSAMRSSSACASSASSACASAASRSASCRRASGVTCARASGSNERGRSGRLVW